jgi:hypothetical protein
MPRGSITASCCALVAALTLAALTLAASAPAAAQDDDPRVDPDSPAGTEYRLPVDRAREQVSGGASAAPGAAPLFGEGVEPADTGSGRRPSSGSAGAGSTTTTGEQPALGTSSPEIVRAQAPPPDGGGGSLVAIAGGAAGVLLIGGLAGLAWRRRSGQA